MTTETSRGIFPSLTKWVRRFLAKPFRELSRTGRISQTLWDAAQLQGQQRSYYQRIGEIALNMQREGKIQNIQIERMMVKIDQIERVLYRQEMLLRSYQRKSDVGEVLREDRERFADRLEPV
jgi:hypothetical protein